MTPQQTIQELRELGATYRQIAANCGFASAGAVHDLANGRSHTCSWERAWKLGDMLKALQYQARKK